MKYFVLLLALACATPYKTKLVPEFIKSWQMDYEITDQTYLTFYKNYLYSVESIFHEMKADDKFPEYLKSVNNTLQLLSHTEFMLEPRYKKMKGRYARTDSPQFKTYRDMTLRKQTEDLNIDREKKMAQLVGPELVAKLKANYLKYQNPRYKLPL